MSEQQNEEFSTGQRSIQEAQGYLPPLPDNNAEAQAAEDKAVNDYVERTTELNRATIAGEDMPLDLGYNKADGSGRIDERHPVSAKKAAEDLSRWREGIAEVDTAIKDQALADEVERLRTAEAAQPQQPEAPPVQEPPPPLPPELQGEGANELAEELRRSPRVLEAVRTMEWQKDQQVAAAQAQAAQFAQEAQRQYAQQLTDNATAAAATVFSAYPELAGLSANDLAAAIQVITKQDPNRGLAIRNHIENVKALTAKAQEAQAVQQQRQQWQAVQQFESWAKTQDEAYGRAEAMDTPQRQTAIRQEAHRMLREYGLSDQEIAANWNSNPMFRSSAAQRILRDAAQFRLNQRTAQSIRPAAVPPVKVATPGSGGMRASEDDHSLRDLNQKLNSSHSARDAAALLSARRARR